MRSLMLGLLSPISPEMWARVALAFSLSRRRISRSVSSSFHVSLSFLVGAILGSLATEFSLPGLLVVFLVAAIMKTGQGGTTPTMITTTAIILPLLPSLGVHPVMAAMAISAAAMIMVHVNDSFFWVVTGFSKMDVAAGYRTVSLLSAVMGVTAFAVISLVGPIILGL